MLGAAYIVIYKLMGSGAYGSEMYVDPLRDPLRFLELGVPKALALIGAQFLAASADLWLISLNARPVLVAIGVLAVVVMGVLVRRLWPRLDEPTRRGLRWLTLGAVMSLVPVLATFPLNRLLLMPSIGFSALTAAVLLQGWRSEDRVLRYGARLLFVTTFIGLIGWPGTAVILRLGADEQTRASLETTITDEALSRRVVVFVAPDPAASLYTPMVRMWHHKPQAQSWVTFSFAPHAHRLTRTAVDTFELEVVEGRMLETVFEQLMRSSRFPVPLGMHVKLLGTEVTVLGLDAGLPNRIQVKFDEDPDLGGYTLAQWKDGHLVSMVLPAVGQTLELPRLRGLLSP